MLAPKPRPLFAMALMLGATVAFVLMQAVVKWARESGLDTTETMFCRIAPVLPFLWWELHKQGLSVVPVRLKHVITRSVLSSLAMSMSFAALGSLSLSHFTILSLGQAALLALLSPRLLGDGRNRGAWLAAGFALVSIASLISLGSYDDDLDAVSALLALLSAVFSAFAHVWTRKAIEHDPIERVVFQFAAMVTLTSLGMGLWRGHFSGLPPGMSGLQFLQIVIGLVALGTLNQALMTRAELHGDSPQLATLGYASIALSMLADTWLFEGAPTLSAYVGAALMLGSGAALIFGAQRVSREGRERART